MKFIKFSSVLGLCLFTITGFSQKTISAKKGQQYETETKTLMTSSAEVMGQSMETTMESKSKTLYEIMNTSSDGIDIQTTITKLKMSTSTMGQEMKYDSDEKDNEGPMAEKLAERVNKPTLVTIDAKGMVIKQDKKEEDDMMGMGGANEARTALFDPAFFSNNITAGMSFIDSSKTKREKYESSELGTYKINSVDNGIASITYSGQQKVSSVMEQMGMEMNNNSVNDIKSEMKVEIGTGLVLSKETVINSTMTIEAAGMSIPATAKTTVSVTTKSLK